MSLLQNQWKAIRDIKSINLYENVSSILFYVLKTKILNHKYSNHRHIFYPGEIHLRHGYFMSVCQDLLHLHLFLWHYDIKSMHGTTNFVSVTQILASATEKYACDFSFCHHDIKSMHETYFFSVCYRKSMLVIFIFVTEIFLWWTFPGSLLCNHDNQIWNARSIQMIYN